MLYSYRKSRIFFNKIKRKYKENKYKKFFNYFNKTWLGKSLPKCIWNFSDLIKTEKNIKNFSFTNNISENINKYINRNLRRARCSSMLFRKNILDTIIGKNSNNKTKS